jgi:hypothetical protein
MLPDRHSRMLLAGIQKNNMDARLRGHDDWLSDTLYCRGLLSFVGNDIGAIPGQPHRSLSEDCVLSGYKPAPTNTIAIWVAGAELISLETTA